MKIPRIAYAAYGFALFVVVLDQLTKAWIMGGLDLREMGHIQVLPPLFNLTWVENRGVSFGLFGPQLAPVLGVTFGADEAYLPSFANALFPSWLVIVFTGALVSAILSSVDSALLAVSAVVTESGYRRLRPDASPLAMLRAARDLTKDIEDHRPAIYWPDMLGSALLGYAGLAGAILLDNPWTAAISGLVAALALYRALLFRDTLPTASEPADARRVLRAEVADAIAGQPGTAWRRDPSGARLLLSAAVPVRVDGQVRAALLIERSNSEVLLLTDRAFSGLLGVSFVVFLASFGLLFLFALLVLIAIVGGGSRQSPLLERIGEQVGSERVAERHALWRQFCSFHGTSAHVVNLLQPDKHPLELGAGLALPELR